MNTIRRWTSLLACASLSTVLFTGCGESAPVKKGAAKELEQAQDLLNAGNSAANSRDYATALVHYNNAKSKIEEARSNATDSESTTLTHLADTIRVKIDDAEIKKLTDTAPTAKPVDSEIRKQEADEKKKADADAKKAADAAKKLADDKLKQEKLLTVGKDTGSSRKDDDGGPALPPSSTAAAGGDKKPAGDNKGGDKAAKDDEAAAAQKAEDESAIEKAKPPYPAVTDKSDEIQVIKIGQRGKYVWVYFQVFNKSDDGKRISVVNVYFKDKDNQKMINEQGVATFPFEGFRESAKDMIGDQGTDALTLGSATIDGRSVKRYVAVGEHDRAKDVKKATVQVVYQEGGKPYAEGPK